MATAGDIISASMNKIGIATPTTAQTATALISLNNMMSMYGADLMAQSLTAESTTLVTTTAVYTWGTAGTFLTTAVPLKLEYCYLRDSDGFDYPIDILSVKDFSEIHDRDVSARPTSVYYSYTTTTGTLTFNRVPDYAYTCYVGSWKNFTEFAATTTDLTMPNEYKEFLVYNLAVSCAEDWDRVVTKTLFARAQETKESIQRLLASQKPPPIAQFDMGIKVGYEITTDTWVG